jgi:hypothetical protein
VLGDISLYRLYPDTRANQRNLLCAENQDFALVDRVAHALKHVRTGHQNSPTIKPLTAGEVIERPPAVWGLMVWDLSRWDDPVGGVTIKDEAELDLLETVKRAAEFLRGKLPPSPTAR